MGGFGWNTGRCERPAHASSACSAVRAGADAIQNETHLTYRWASRVPPTRKGVKTDLRAHEPNNYDRPEAATVATLPKIKKDQTFDIKKIREIKYRAIESARQQVAAKSSTKHAEKPKFITAKER